MNVELSSCPVSVKPGQRMHGLIRELFPICRSITGDGLRETLCRLQLRIPLTLHEVPTGTPVFDWTIPREWNIRDAWLKDPSGRKVVDFRQSNLHVVNYSAPVHGKFTLRELRPRLHSLPDRPEWTPYRTSYYREDWGFCLPHRLLEQLPEGEYEAYIDSSLGDGSLTYGELELPGETSDEILISSHVCHPSLANDNLSGIAVAVELATRLAQVRRRHTIRFLFAPGTIGAIAWLACNEERTKNIRHGLVLACLGDAGRFHYKRSRHGNADVDRAVCHVLSHHPDSFHVRDFSPMGYDERQFGSPGFNLAVGNLSRTPHGKFPEYHTSADDCDFVRPDALEGSLEVCLQIIDVLESNGRYRNRNPKCEPQLGRRGLYRAMGGFADSGRRELAMLWVLNQSDGEHSLLDIAERADLPFASIAEAAKVLENHDLLERIEEAP